MAEKLTIEQVREWAKAIQTGSPEEAGEAMTEAYIKGEPFIKHVTKKATKPGLDFYEMLSAGIEGYVTALARFDYMSPKAKLGFIGSYVRNYVLREASQHMTPLNLPYSAYSRDNRIAALTNILTLTGEEPTDEAVAEASTNPLYSRAGYGRKRSDGTDRQPAPISAAQVRDWRIRQERMFTDVDMLADSIPGDNIEDYSLLDIARTLAISVCAYPETAIEHFESGKLNNTELAERGVSRVEYNRDIKELVNALRQYVAEEEII